MKPFVIVAALLLLNPGWAADTAWKPPTEEEYQAKLDKLSRPDRWEYRVSKDGVITRVTPTPATEGPDIEWVKQFRQKRIEAGNPREPLRVYYFNTEPGKPVARSAQAVKVGQAKPGVVPPKAAAEPDKDPAPSKSLGQEPLDVPAEDAGKPPEQEKPPADADLPGTYEVYVGGKLVGTLELLAGGDLRDWNGNKGSTYRWLYKDQTLTLQLGSDLQRLSFKGGAFEGSILTVKKGSADGREATVIDPATEPEQPKVQPVKDSNGEVASKDPLPEAPKRQPTEGGPTTKMEGTANAGEAAGVKPPALKEDPDWPPKEVNPAPEDPKALYPTEEEIETIKKLCVEGKNSGDYKKFSEAEKLGKQIVGRMCTGSNLAAEEWGKRFAEANKLREVLEKAYGYSSLSTYQLSDALAEDFAKTEGHAAFFSKLKWLQSHAGNMKFDARRLRVITYKYIENNPEKFKDNAAKQLFCQQLIKGGINDQGLKELSESLK